MTMQALIHLGGVVEHVEAALDWAKKACDGLEGARLVRARELESKLAEALTFVQRLEFIVEGDIRAE